MRALAFAASLLLLAGCVESDSSSKDASESLVIDADRPAPTFGQIVTGPAVGPDLNATTEKAPRLAEGEWWRIRFDSSQTGETIEVVRVVANATPTGYIIGMPHEGWLKEAIAFHAPAFGDVALDLSYNTHNVKFEPVRFPLKEGATWETEFALTPYTATVESADMYTASIYLEGPADNSPQAPIMQAAGLSGPPAWMRLTFDARQHEIIKMESWIGNWEVVEHGYGFEGWITVPRGEHTAIDYGVFGGPVGDDHNMDPREIEVKGGFNRLTMMHLIAPITPGSYEIRDVTPEEGEFVTKASTDFVIRFYESSKPDGTWSVQDKIGGVAATYSMGIAYHQYDIHLPDGQRRADHNHDVIR